MVFQRDFLKDDISDLTKVDIVWCSAVLEHVESPFIFLKKIYQLLNSGGLLFLYTPIIPILPFLGNLPGIGKYISGFNNKDHIYAYVPITLKFLCERAGFYTIEVSPFYPSFLRIFNKIPIINQLTGRVVYVGQKNLCPSLMHRKE